jgi:hypothetical protein
VILACDGARGAETAGSRLAVGGRGVALVGSDFRIVSDDAAWARGVCPGSFGRRASLCSKQNAPHHHCRRPLL